MIYKRIVGKTPEERNTILNEAVKEGLITGSNDKALETTLEFITMDQLKNTP
jgi:hypothetical protein